MLKVTVFKNPLEWDNAKHVLAFIGLVFTGSAPPMNTTKFELALTDHLLTITAFTQNDQNEWVDYVKEIDVKEISFCSLDQKNGSWSCKWQRLARFVFAMRNPNVQWKHFITN